MYLCPNCGAEFDKTDKECPYCGYINYHGAEAAYMDELGNIVNTMDQVDDESKKLYKEEFKRQGKFVWKIMAVIFPVLIIGLVLVVGVIFYLDRPVYSDEQIATQILFEQTYYLQLDEWYEQEEYDLLVDFFCEQMEKNENTSNLYSWEHTYFVYEYMDYKNYLEVKTKYESGQELISDDIEPLMWFYFEEDYSFDAPEKDIIAVEGYRSEVGEFLRNEIGFTEEECEELQAIMDDGKINFYEAYEGYAKEKVK